MLGSRIWKVPGFIPIRPPFLEMAPVRCPIEKSSETLL